MRMILSVAATLLVACTGANPGGDALRPCQYFYSTLAALPHDTLNVSSGEGVWLWERGSETEALSRSFVGCEVRFVTNDSLTVGFQVPMFDPLEGSEMYSLGWRFTPGVLADGPGSGIFGLHKDSVECLVDWNQEAYIDDNGDFWQSDVLEMTIQCRGPGALQESAGQRPQG